MKIKILITALSFGYAVSPKVPVLDKDGQRCVINLENEETPAWICEKVSTALRRPKNLLSLQVNEETLDQRSWKLCSPFISSIIVTEHLPDCTVTYFTAEKRCPSDKLTHCLKLELPGEMQLCFREMYKGAEEIDSGKSYLKNLLPYLFETHGKKLIEVKFLSAEVSIQSESRFLFFKPWLFWRLRGLNQLMRFNRDEGMNWGEQPSETWSELFLDKYNNLGDTLDKWIDHHQDKGYYVLDPEANQLLRPTA